MPVPKLPQADYRQLVLARQLIDQAEAFVDQRTPAALGLGVSVAQDAAELVLRALTRGWQLSVPQPQNILFNQLVDAVEAALNSFGVGALPFRNQLFELNRARVDFKHFGHVPTEQVARQHFGNAAAFLESVCSSVLGIAPDDLSITDLIEDDAIREAIKAGEVAAKAGDNSQALCKAALAMWHLSHRMSRAFPRKRARLEIPAPELRSFAETIATEVNAAVELAAFALLRADPWGIGKFTALTPKVNGISAEHLQYVWTSVWPQHVEPEGVAFCLEYVRDLAIQVQERVPQWWNDPMPIKRPDLPPPPAA